MTRLPVERLRELHALYSRTSGWGDAITDDIVAALAECLAARETKACVLEETAAIRSELRTIELKAAAAAEAARREEREACAAWHDSAAQKLEGLNRNDYDRRAGAVHRQSAAHIRSRT